MEQLDAMFQTLRGAAGVAERQDPEAHRTNILMEFMKSKPPIFEGSLEHETSERWLKEVKEKFDTFGVPQEYWVGFATYLFEGLVEEWWDLHMDEYDASNLSWDEFETLFREKYAPGTHGGQLIQGNMTVAQYHARFLELFDCDPTVAADPTLRCVKFKVGLRPKIRSKLAPLPMTDFSVLVAAALLTEADLIRNCGGKKESSGCHKKMSKKDNLDGHNKFSSSGRYQPYPCAFCHNRGHKTRDCPRLLRKSEKRRRRLLRRCGSLLISSSMVAQNLSGGEKDQLQGQCSQGSKTNENGGLSHPLNVCNCCKKKGHTKRCQNMQQKSPLASGDTKEKYVPICHHCYQEGHVRRACPYRQHTSGLASGDQHKNEFSPAAPVTNSSTSFTPQPHGFLPQYYNPQMLLQGLRFQQSRNASSTPPSGSQSCSQPQIAPCKNLPVGKINKLQGQKSQHRGTSGSSRPLPNTCHICHQIGHLKQDCPYWQQNPSASFAKF